MDENGASRQTNAQREQKKHQNNELSELSGIKKFEAPTHFVARLHLLSKNLAQFRILKQ